MDILAALAASKPPEPKETTINDNNRFSFVSDGVFKKELQSMGLDKQTIDDCMFYDVSARDFLLDYFKKKKYQ